MKLKSAVLASLLAVASASAFSATPTYYNYTLVDNGVNFTSAFGNSHLAGDFTDVFYFLPGSVGGLTDVHFSTTGYTPDAVISFSGATLNSYTVSLSPATTMPDGGLTSGGGLAPSYVPGAITLTISGHSYGAASYAGTLNVTAVPEPTTYGMLMAGLGVVGFMARRRKQG